MYLVTILSTTLRPVYMNLPLVTVYVYVQSLANYSENLYSRVESGAMKTTKVLTLSVHIFEWKYICVEQDIVNVKVFTHYVLRLYMLLFILLTY